MKKLTPEKSMEMLKKSLNPNNELTFGRLDQIIMGSPPTEDEVHQIVLLMQRDYNYRYRNPKIKAKPSRNKKEGGYYSDRLGCYCYWRTRGPNSRKRIHRAGLRQAKLRKLYEKDPSHASRAYNLQASQGDEFAEVLFPTITIGTDTVGKPIPPRPVPWYKSASYIRRQLKKGK